MKEKIEKRQPCIGDIYLMRFDGTGNEQKGWRPGLVFQNNVGNMHSPNIIALPITKELKKTNQPTHVSLDAKTVGLRYDSMVLCENPERMSKERIGMYISSLSEEDMGRVAIANLLSSSAIAFIDPDVLLSIWQQAFALNTAGQKQRIA